jgi:hypothetical protein
VILIAALLLHCLNTAPAWADLDPDLSEVYLVPPDGPTVPWNQLLNQNGGDTIQFGVNILGPSPYSRNELVPFPPASNTKLFTTGAALELLGPDFRYETILSWIPVDPDSADSITGLTLIGSGDPSWGMTEIESGPRARIDSMVATLVQEGVRSVRGPIRALGKDPRMDRLQIPPGWETSDLVACYGALPQSFILQENCENFIVTGKNSGHWRGGLVPTRVRVNLSTGPSTRISATSYIDPKTSEPAFKITGTWAAGSGPASLNLPVPHAREWVKNLLVASLNEHGITWDPNDGSDALVPVAPRELRFYSPRLAEITVPLNKHSINVAADALFKTLGSRFGDTQKDLLSASMDVMRDYVSHIGARAARAKGLPRDQGSIRQPSTAPRWRWAFANQLRHCCRSHGAPRRPEIEPDHGRALDLASDRRRGWHAQEPNEGNSGRRHASSQDWESQGLLQSRWIRSQGSDRRERGGLRLFRGASAHHLGKKRTGPRRPRPCRSSLSESLERK